MTSRARLMKNTDTTVIMMSKPGGMTHHHATRHAPDNLAACKIVPHEYVCGGPRPRKLNVASAVMAKAMDTANCSRARGNTFGAMWTYIVRKLLAPAVRAAFTKGRLARESTCARMMRAVERHVSKPTAKMTMA